MKVATLCGIAACAGLAAAPARADIGIEMDVCWTAGERVAGVIVNYAEVENPAKNYTILHEPRRFREVHGIGVVVTNGTFFEGRLKALGEVLIPGEEPYAYAPREIHTGDGRFVDLGQRWGVGVRKDTGRLEVVQDIKSAALMSTYLGGGGILLSSGTDVTDKNWQDWRNTSIPGPSFPDEFRTRVVARTALGIRNFDDGRQTLLVVGVPPFSGANVRKTAQILKQLGASDAVFYDGGGATAFAAGPRNGHRSILVRPTNAGEDLNPTHIVITACR